MAAMDETQHTPCRQRNPLIAAMDETQHTLCRQRNLLMAAMDETHHTLCRQQSGSPINKEMHSRLDTECRKIHPPLVATCAVLAFLLPQYL